MVIEKLPNEAGMGRNSVYLVKKAAGGDEQIIGMLEKYPNTRSETHPWKAWAGWGMNRVFLRSFYENEGGKTAAINAIKFAHEDRISRV